MKKKIFILCLSLLLLILTGCGAKTTKQQETTKKVNTTVTQKVVTTTKEFVPTTVTTINKQEVENDQVTVKQTLSSATIENSFISASFDLDNGSLNSLINKKAGTDYLKDSKGGDWAMTVDVSTANKFETDYQGENAVVVSSRKQTDLEFSVDKRDDGATLSFIFQVSFSFNNKKYKDIVVKQEVTLLNGMEELLFSYEIENNSSEPITICNFTGAQLSGLKDSANGALSLFWPNKEGKIYENAIDKIKNTTKTDENLVNVYPGTCSMQLIQLYNSKESIYVYVKDNTREYKKANYGNFTSSGDFDYNEVTDADKISLSFTQFPFVSSGETKKVFDTVIGISVGEGWYRGSDKYQEFLYESDMINTYETYPENWNGFIPLVGSQYGSKHFSSYVASGVGEISYADWVLQAEENSGVDTELVLGWYDGGFDSMYPDYDFVEGEGFNGAEGFREMTQMVHLNGDLVCNHMNSRIADMQSNWSMTEIKDGLTNLQLAGVKQAGFKSSMTPDEYDDYLICETYGSGTMYYVMSSASKEFQDQMIAVVTRLRENGSNGLWFDQLYERDAYLDYDESHKMSESSTPATLYFEGYEKILSAFKEIGKTINPTEPWIIVCGGLGGDYLAKWTDVYGGSWGRKLGANDNTQDSRLDGNGTENCDRHLMSPELIEYTVPAVYIGLAGAGTLSGQTDEYARAFLFGSPFLAEQFTTSTNALISTYDFYPDIFYRGTFKDRLGLQVSDSDVMASILLSRTEDRFGLQLYNYDKNPSKGLKVYIDLSKINGGKAIKSITNVFSGETYTLDGNCLTIDLVANEFVSLIFEY